MRALRSRIATTTSATATSVEARPARDNVSASATTAMNPTAYAAAIALAQGDCEQDGDREPQVPGELVRALEWAGDSRDDVPADLRRPTVRRRILARLLPARRARPSRVMRGGRRCGVVVGGRRNDAAGKQEQILRRLEGFADDRVHVDSRESRSGPSRPQSPLHR